MEKHGGTARAGSVRMPPACRGVVRISGKPFSAYPLQKKEDRTIGEKK